MTENRLHPCYVAMRCANSKTREDPDLMVKTRLRIEFIHATDVLKWINKLYFPLTPSFELQAAGLLHDCERWYNTGESTGFKGDRDSLYYLEHKKQHAKRSAEFADRILQDNSIDLQTRSRVQFLIEHHDDTGEEILSLNDSELKILAAADSFSFFTSIAPDMLYREGADRVKNKVRFMVSKMPKELRLLLSLEQFGVKEIETIRDEVLQEFRGEPNI